MTVVTIAVTTVMIDMVETTVSDVMSAMAARKGMAVTSAIAMNVTERTVIGRTVAGKSALPTLANGLGHPLVVPTMTIVAPGRLPPRGNMMKGGLQGTMIAEVCMMIVEVLTLIMIAAGMTAGVKRRMTVTRKDPPGQLPMEITVGRAE